MTPTRTRKTTAKAAAKVAPADQAGARAPKPAKAAATAKASRARQTATVKTAQAANAANGAKAAIPAKPEAGKARAAKAGATAAKPEAMPDAGKPVKPARLAKPATTAKRRAATQPKAAAAATDGKVEKPRRRKAGGAAASPATPPLEESLPPAAPRKPSTAAAHAVATAAPVPPPALDDAHVDGALALDASTTHEDGWHDFGVVEVDALPAPAASAAGAQPEPRAARHDDGADEDDDERDDGASVAARAAAVFAADEEDEQDDDEQDDDDRDDADEDDDADDAAGDDEQGDDQEDDQDEDEQDEDDDTPLGESVSTDASGGLDPAVAAAARRLGIQRLYPEQERGIRETLAGEDVLIVMPTGFGKSACYQVPSMVLPKPVVLISPLLALLKDQHEKLIKYQVPSVRLDGTVRGKARAEALKRIGQGGSLLVMTTPETLGSEEMHGALSKSGISLAAIDEAHCISEWGFDFRPAYLRLGEVLRGLGRPPMLGLTATATEKVRTDIVRFLGMRAPTIVASSPHRSNLAFEVLECREAARLRALARLAQRLRRPGIIYCSTTREVDTVYTILARLGIPVHRYHGKMAAGERSTQQDMFMKPGRRTVMVATSAFGLGIDKSDIRYVVHQQSPASLEQYVQEAGRAGRDGAKANCILLHDPADRTVHEALLSRSRLRPDQLYKLGSALAAWAAEGRTPTIDALALSADLGERPTNALLATLEEADLVRIAEDQTVHASVPPGEVEEKARSLAGQFANMRTQDSRRLDSVADYAQSKDCRAAYLRSYFGEEHGTPCGLCDVCRGRPERPSTFWSPVASPKRMNKKRRRGRGRNQMPQQGKRRRGGRGAPGRPGPHPVHARGPGGGQPQQHRPHPNQGGGPPREQQHGQQSLQDGNAQQRRSRRRRRRGRRGRRGRPNPAAAPPSAPPSEG